MYQFSRAIYREVAEFIVAEDHEFFIDAETNHERVLRACEATMERLATDRHYFAKPARRLFNDIRIYFPLHAQRRVCQVVVHYVAMADEYVASLPQRGVDIHGAKLMCRATTRKGTACQREPLPHNGYCPSHQHLVETESTEVLAAA